MSLSEECCSIPQVKSDYEPLGATDEIDGLKIYHTGADSEVGLIVVYDIFGFHNNTKQFADILAKLTNSIIVMPDFFRGSKKPESREETQVWIKETAPLEKVKKDLEVTIEYLKKKGASKFGILGFCWGAKPSIEACKKNKVFSCVAVIHPSAALVTEDAKEINVPVALLPAKTDADMVPFLNVLEEHDAESFKKSIHKRFDDMHHGFAAARGDWSDPLQAQRAQEALQLLATFFKTNV